MADTEFSEGFIAQTEKMIAELRAELVPYEDGSAQARVGENDKWDNATLGRIAQIKREIVALENSLARHGKADARGPGAAEGQEPPADPGPLALGPNFMT